MLSSQITKENHRYKIGGPLLLFFSTPFIVWQMGMLFYSGTTMSLFGGTPIPLEGQVTEIVIASGYLASIIALCLFPRKAVWMERVLMPLAFVCTALILLPLSSAAVTALFYISAFCCVFSIGVMLSIAAQHLALETVWSDGIISMAVGGAVIALMHSGLFEIDFTVFALLALALTAMQSVFYWTIPARIEAVYIDRKREKMPGVLFAGIWLIIGFSTLLICFASSYAESVKNGVSALYLSAAVMAAALRLLRKKLGVKIIRVFGAFFAVAVFGFVLAYLSLELAALRLVACACLGLVVVLANLWLYFAAVSFSVYPIHYVGAIGAGLGLALALLHSGLLELLRDNTTLLYGVYAALSVALLLVYNFMEPYFVRAWNKPRGEKHDGEAAPAQTQRPAKDDPFAALSEQERILAELILDGHSETSAARAMNITLNTQKGYRKNLYTKLDIHTKRELFELDGAR